MTNALRPAFTLIAAIALVAILAISAAVTIPVLVGIIDAQRAQDTLDDFRSIAKGDSAFFTFLGRLPGRISHLADPIASADSTTCNGIAPSASAVTYGGTTAGKWPNNAPYLYRASETTGFGTAIGVIDDIQYRETANNTAGAIDLVIAGARLEDAENLNDLADGTAEVTNADRSNTLGMVRWPAPTAENTVSLKYRVSFTAAC
jgi:type II secretory pathway pseudopilin PulG